MHEHWPARAWVMGASPACSRRDVRCACVCSCWGCSGAAGRPRAAGPCRPPAGLCSAQRPWDRQTRSSCDRCADGRGAAVPGDRSRRPLAAAATAAACRWRLCCPGSRNQRVPPFCSLPSRVCSQLAQQRQRLQAAGSNGRPHSHAAAGGGENVRGVRLAAPDADLSALVVFLRFGLLLLHMRSCCTYQ